jgi:hypothetical protein
MDIVWDGVKTGFFMRTASALGLTVALAVSNSASAGPKTIAATLSGHKVCDSRGGSGVYGRNGTYTYTNAAGQPASGNWSANGADGVHVSTTRGAADLVFTPSSSGFSVSGTLGNFDAHLCQ